MKKFHGQTPRLTSFPQLPARIGGIIMDEEDIPDLLNENGKITANFNEITRCSISENSSPHSHHSGSRPSTITIW